MANDNVIVTKTNDEYVVELFAKMEIKGKIEDYIEGVTILGQNKSQSEEELYIVYKELVDKMDYNPVIIKVNEIQKEIELLKTQIRAILRVAVDGDVSIMFPKVCIAKEIREYKEILEQCQKELELEKVQYRKHMKIGIIVEIPSTALMSYELARECDFFFLDTDSITNYAFGNKKNTQLCEKLQLPVIKLIQQAIEGAHDAGIFCGICGQAVENELYMPLLIGLGLDQFSIEENKIPEVREHIHFLNKSECKDLVEEIMQQRTQEEIEIKLRQFYERWTMKIRGGK